MSLCIMREFGWIFNLSSEELEKALSKVNEKRKFEHHLNVDAAVTLFGSSEKSKNELKDNPFYKDFDCGKTMKATGTGIMLNFNWKTLPISFTFFCLKINVKSSSNLIIPNDIKGVQRMIFL